ncbi:MAG TPA: hypothetical protein VKV03_03595 [Candidatus Binataceae bacterium]|nr:hypothetical protein [Candidatus Binataceae bacterium]
MRSFALAVLFGLISFCARTAFAAPASGAEPETYVRRAAFSDGRLWIITSEGTLFSLNESSEHRVDEGLPDRALDLCVQRQHPVIVTCAGDRCRSWNVWRYLSGKLVLEDSIRTQGDDLAGVACSDNDLVVLTSRRLIDLEEGRLTSVALSYEIARKELSLLSIGRDLLVGVNDGEFGGGLWRINGKTGEVNVVDRRAPGELCGGPLNSDCDPVTGIALEPWKPPCAAVAIGLQHLFMSSGRIDEVCRDSVRELYSKPHDEKWAIAENRRNIDSIPFYGLASTKDALWSAGLDGIYRIDETGVTRVAAPTKYKSIDGIKVNFEFPDLVFVLGTISSRPQENGAVPMIVAR